jgi:hypothetical protein
VFDEAGHFPHLEDPIRFARVLRDFVEDTEPARLDFSDEYLDALRELMRDHLAGAGDVPAG